MLQIPSPNYNTGYSFVLIYLPHTLISGTCNHNNLINFKCININKVLYHFLVIYTTVYVEDY